MARKKVVVYIDEVTWTCGDCGNRYDYGVTTCPNKRLDNWMLKKGPNESA